MGRGGGEPRHGVPKRMGERWGRCWLVGLEEGGSCQNYGAVPPEMRVQTLLLPRFAPGRADHPCRVSHHPRPRRGCCKPASLGVAAPLKKKKSQKGCNPLPGTPTGQHRTHTPQHRRHPTSSTGQHPSHRLGAAAKHRGRAAGTSLLCLFPCLTQAGPPELAEAREQMWDMVPEELKPTARRGKSQRLVLDGCRGSGAFQRT